jgi:mono/diheme cytochrome c family protein
MTKLLTTAVAGCGFFVLIGQQAAQQALPAVYTAAQAAAGRTAYQSSCAKCHTDTLVGRDGTGEVPEFLRAYGGKIPPLAGANSAFPPFMTKWGARTTKALYTRIREAVGGFPPPDRRLDEELYLNLTAYILQANGARPGTQALTTATAVEIRSIATGAAPQTTAAVHEAGGGAAPRR